MKKSNLKSLKLNKKAISNFQITGGERPTSDLCVPMRSDNNNTCEPVTTLWLSILPGVVCR